MKSVQPINLEVTANSNEIGFEEKFKLNSLAWRSPI
jgi:hypothetical protein